MAGLRLAMIAMIIACWALPAAAESLRLNDELCHAVTPLRQADTPHPALSFSCRGSPTGYQQASLWLRADLTRLPVDRNDVVLMLHQSRFDRLTVIFGYADGTAQRQEVSGGAFGSHWRAGGQIAFEAPVRDAPLTAVTMRVDRLASESLLHLRLVTRGEAGAQSAALAATIGAALMLLLVAVLYNLSLATAVRRQFLGWHGAWAACMLLWGLIWSQLDLLVVPAMAGTISAQTCTFLACLAIALATASVVTALGREVLPARTRTAMLALGGAVALFGVPLALVRSAAIDTLAGVASILILADLLAVAACLAWAWRRGSAEARDFAAAWSVPMATLALIQLVDIDGAFWGAGSKLVILVAAAWQTLWLSIAATRRFAQLRVERDRARADEAQASELARRDPLTGLRNRRGFIETIAPLLDHERSAGAPVALLLIDIDRFKSVNDAHGHEAGDRVLITIAERLTRWEGPMCTVARLGGEEFALMIAGIEGFALARFADNVCREIGACDHQGAIGPRTVTASIGVAETRAQGDFQQLYRLADQALYVAKQEGRNRVVIRPFTLAPPVPILPSPAEAGAQLGNRG